MKDATEQLLRRAGEGSQSAVNHLLAKHRGRLRRMVAARMDDRLAQRIDPSDVVQEALADAQRRFDAYLRDRPVSFYPWLRQLAWNRLVDLHRRHLHAGKRSIVREASPTLSGDSVEQVTRRLASRELCPSERILKEELKQRVLQTLDCLPESDREIVILRHVEELSVQEVAQTLGLPAGTVKSRHFRAIQRLRSLMDALDRE
jgi:RNA polymerase sigma-70 factor (ECF subfamily)